ncbi:MAG: diaminopimelate decarboxylase [Bacteroidetes bacterium RIFCSPLOWO2_12_FULL_35_15]|nr:MAG: diaminopimelate decarboxylase [Bacteroidetes bacterium RIFCSPLOWO2_12_FULL_35_15]
MFEQDIVNKFKNIPTPFYYYDVEVLKQTLQQVKAESDKYNFNVHYALKANANNEILNIIKTFNFGADCVSGNEVKKAVECGYASEHIVFAGVGKSDAEINFALDHNIFCFNCESLQELEVINELANAKNKTANVALRINPNVNANTHKYITTGLEENKFGINLWELESVVNALTGLKNIQLIGLHFHIGSQITDLSSFKSLCMRVNEIQSWFVSHKIKFENINVGGGLGVDYHEPDKNLIADFAAYFKLFNDFLELRPGQKVHFELGRAIVAQCGTLISKVLYIKKGVNTNFAILDAGMTELMRPALYQAYHKIENISKENKVNRQKTIDKNLKPNIQYPISNIFKYDVVGPICESSDCFGKAVNLPETFRGDLIAIRTAGAYGEVMSSGYNLRDRVKNFYSDKL